MTHRVRRILFWTTILFFILFTPIILLYACGYSFDWQKKKPVLTGGFYIKSIPKKADVYINDKLIRKTPAFIKRIKPDEYQIRVSKDGFHSWQKKLKVESKLVTEAKDILLIPQKLGIETVQEKISENFSLREFLSQGEPANIFYVQKPSYILYRTDSTNSFQEQISSVPLPSSQEYQIFTSLNGKIAVLSEKGQLYLFNPETKSFEILAENVQSAQFSDEDKKLLYFNPNEIYVYYLEDTSSQLNKKAGQKELITRFSQRVKQALWYPETNEHIIFAVDQTVKIIELDDRGDYRNIYDLFESEINQIGYHPIEKKIYFIQGKKLLRTSLLE